MDTAEKDEIKQKQVREILDLIGYRVYRADSEIARRVARDLAQLSVGSLSDLYFFISTNRVGKEMPVGVYKTTTYHRENRDREAILVAWWAAEDLLGHAHDGVPEDDELLVEALVEAGAPGWIREAEGVAREEGIYLVRTERSAS